MGRRRRCSSYGNVLLNKINPSSGSTGVSNAAKNTYFNNKGLLDIADYAQQKYINAPTDKSMTQFFKLFRNQVRSYDPVPLEITATYWHFVDVLWIYLFVFFLLKL